MLRLSSRAEVLAIGYVDTIPSAGEGSTQFFDGARTNIVCNWNRFFASDSDVVRRMVVQRLQRSHLAALRPHFEHFSRADSIGIFTVTYLGYCLLERGVVGLRVVVRMVDCHLGKLLIAPGISRFNDSKPFD